MVRSWAFPVIRILLMAAAACVLAGPAQSVAASEAPGVDPRNVDATSFGERVELGSNWLFATGDRLEYASPGFDDRDWKVVSAKRQLTDYGFHDFPYAWYRLHVHVRPGTGNLQIGLSGVAGSYEVYANGIQIGHLGDIRGMPRFNQIGLFSFEVPDKLVTPQGDLLLAIRFAVNVTSDRGRGTSVPIDRHSRIYLLSRESARIDASYLFAHSAFSYVSLAFLSLLVGSVAVALYAALPVRKEYLAVAVYLLACSGSAAVAAWDNFYAITFEASCLRYLCIGFANMALIEFLRLLLGKPRSSLFICLEIISFIAPLESPLTSSSYGAIASTVSPTIVFTLKFFPILIVTFLLPVMLLQACIRGNREARVLLPAMLLYGLAQNWEFVRNVLFYTGTTPTLENVPSLYLDSYHVSLHRICEFVFYITMLLFLVIRTIGIARERARVAAELAAARTTQQLLLARSSHETPGFRVESVYHPASEVGGDFFYVCSTPAGSLLAIVGDVSGKGLIAAMRVAMILGVLRREDSWEPSEVLYHLNEALLSQGELGFTTACCVRIDPDSASGLYTDGARYTVANAGHIPPYIDGQETATMPALPLGLAPDQHYIQTSGRLSPQQRLVMLSDGVLEARSSTGELLGFDRLSALTRKSAKEIADTAKNFGQEDDITVLALSRMTTAEEPSVKEEHLLTV